MKKVELLAPAGNFDALKGAINAGADAIYLGGEQFGARAYANNFSQDEICAGIRLAHMFGRKIYLTVNTLVKEKELDGLYEFLLPAYKNGLDGVIVQDLGALCYIREHFPNLELHASTQMTLTGSYGVNFLKENGVSRVVPARELSLAEMKKMKENTGVELEVFIHGAMCYCYSGQCLFSSILGGRSGNRGRCAQPCRLPYQVGSEKESYPLSMRDMCTIHLIPQLIEAGIDSFKIEGRMKKPAYAAGVSAIYRKYIDLYYEDKNNYHVEKEDLELLNSLYIRSEVGDGYYHRHNGKEMITLDSPAYSETNEKLLCRIEEKYINPPLFKAVNAKVEMTPGIEAVLTLSDDKTSVTCRGDIVQTALKQPLSEEKIEQQIKKSGNSLLKIEEVELNINGEVFMPVATLNELRRQAVEQMENQMLLENGFDFQNRTAKETTTFAKKNEDKKSILAVDVLVNSKEQLLTVLSENIRRLYIDYNILVNEGEKELFSLLCNYEKHVTEVYVATPYIVRHKDKHYLDDIRSAIENKVIHGVLIRNIESYGYLREFLSADQIILDCGVYIWNRDTVGFWAGKAKEFYLPTECNSGEWRALSEVSASKEISFSAVAYGRIPMMITANCIQKTSGKCNGKSGVVAITDRYEKVFPIYHDCLCCYNIIYNSVPLSLHKLFKEKWRWGNGYRLDFTTEGKDEVLNIVRYFNRIKDNYTEPSYTEYTTGHYKRGVE